jgi:hypothetical protein
VFTVKTLRTIFVATLCLVAAWTLQAGAAGRQLAPKPADPAEIKGTYNLILYGCRYPDDLENMAILVNEDSPYPLEVYALDGMYKVKKGLPGPQALSEANTFLNCSAYTVWQTVLRSIPDGAGKTVGYELKPLYRSWEVRVPEPLLSSYTLKDGKVTAYIRLDPLLEDRDSGDGQRDSSGGMQ